MKFGALLKTSCADIPQLSSVCDFYKQTKKALKLLPRKSELHAQGDGTALTEQEAAFARQLTEQVDLWNNEYLESEEICVMTMEHLESQVMVSCSREQVWDVARRLVDFHGETLLLMHWSVLAYTAILKLLKKHHKRTGLLVKSPHLQNLLREPFCSTEVTSALLQRAEACIQRIRRSDGATVSGEAIPSVGSAAAPVDVDVAQLHRAAADMLDGASSEPEDTADSGEMEWNGNGTSRGGRVSTPPPAAHQYRLHNNHHQQPQQQQQHGRTPFNNQRPVQPAAMHHPPQQHPQPPPPPQQQQQPLQQQPPPQPQQSQPQAQQTVESHQSGASFFAPPPPPPVSVLLAAPGSAVLEKKTRLAISTWEQMRSTASTPSTVLGR